MAKSSPMTPDQIYQPNNSLDQLAYQVAQQPVQPTQYRNQGEVPYSMGLDVTPPDKGVVMGNYLHNLAGNYIQQQQQSRDMKFLKSVHDVMASNLSSQDTKDTNGKVVLGKISHLMDLNTQHGGGYLDDTLKQLSDVMKNSSVAAVQGSQIDLNSAREKQAASAVGLNNARSNQITNPLNLQPQDEQLLANAGSVPPDQILNNLSPGAGATINGILDYSVNPNTYQIRNNLRGQLVQLAKQIDPSYDQKMFQMRSKFMNEFYTGTSGQAITSAKQTLYHLNELHDSVQNLQNTGSPLLNAPLNKWNQLVKGDPTVTDVTTNLTAVAEELTKAWAGSNNGEARVREWQNSLNSAASPQQWNAVFSKATKLLNDALKARASQYKTVMGKDPQGLLNPEEQQIITKLSGLYGNSPLVFNKGAVGGQQVQPMTATNPQTKQRIQSLDGGQTWQPAQ